MINHQETLLKKILQKIKQEHYPVHSRVHPLNSMNGFVKRDDELGFGIPGSKIRKYRTVIPKLKECKHVLVIGGAQSNNVLGISQLLKENKVPFTLLLREGFARQMSGNAFLLRQIVLEEEIQVIPRDQWSRIDKIADDIKGGSDSVYILPEGAFTKEAFFGALTLPLDIIKNENEFSIQFQDIFVDAGTGLTAIALILGLHFLKKEANVHVLLLAGTKKEFEKNLRCFKKHLEEVTKTSISFPKNYRLLHPENAASFGATNKTLFQKIAKFMHQEGFFVDPIYSGKLFVEAKRIIEKERIESKPLIIHSGGGFSLFGFKTLLKSALYREI